MREFIDISLGTSPDLPVWPGSSGFSIRQERSLADGHLSNETRLEINSHFGTHVDAPLHFFESGRSVDRLPLEAMIGPALVVDLEGRRDVTADALEASKIPEGMNRLILRTDNSRYWNQGCSAFRKDYVALTDDGAQWIVDHGIRLVGIDYLSIQRFSGAPRVHQILLGHDVVVLEGLDLSGVPGGSYQLVCLPLRVLGAEGAPARAVLIKRSADEAGGSR